MLALVHIADDARGHVPSHSQRRWKMLPARQQQRAAGSSASGLEVAIDVSLPCAGALAPSSAMARDALVMLGPGSQARGGRPRRCVAFNMQV